MTDKQRIDEALEYLDGMLTYGTISEEEYHDLVVILGTEGEHY